MFKILYAAQNNSNAAIQLARFMLVMQDKPIQVKISAYKNSIPKGMNIDWCLDSLLDIQTPDTIYTDTDSFDIYFRQVKSYNPDLVISDLEYFTSYIANILNIPLWQYSSSLLNFAISALDKHNTGLFTKYSYLMKKESALRTGRQVNIIDNSDYNFVYSHLGDTINPPKLVDKYKWVRPYHIVGKASPPCRHNIVAATSHNDRNILRALKKYGDSVIFTEYPYEQQPGLWMKDICDLDEYFCNIKNCKLFVCKGQTSYMADAFYNGKYTATITDFNDLECVMNSLFSERQGLSSMIYTYDEIGKHLDKEVKCVYNCGVRYLHEYIDGLI